MDCTLVKCPWHAIKFHHVDRITFLKLSSITKNTWIDSNPCILIFSYIFFWDKFIKTVVHVSSCCLFHDKNSKLSKDVSSVCLQRFIWSIAGSYRSIAICINIISDFFYIHSSRIFAPCTCVLVSRVNQFKTSASFWAQ